MKINKQEYIFQDISRVLTVPDCNVLGPNKIGRGHGEAKFYFGSKDVLNAFSLGKRIMTCFILKSDLLNYMQTARKEYSCPTQNYAGRLKMPDLWFDRINQISKLPEVIEFTVEIQSQIEGTRGYINSSDKAFKLLRELSLPLISYISIMRLQDANGRVVYYWKLFVDFDAIDQKGMVPQVFTYGKKQKNKTEKIEKKHSVKTYGRDADSQRKYRDKLLEECPYCPITKISDERLLIASHIKPFAVSEKNEAFDPKNGFILSPLYDRLFDQGFISFDEKKCLMVSNWLSPSNQVKCNIKVGDFIQMLPLDKEREIYMKYHRQYVFKG